MQTPTKILESYEDIGIFCVMSDCQVI